MGTRFSQIEHALEMLKNKPVSKEGDTIVMQDDEKFMSRLDSLEDRLSKKFDEKFSDLE